MSIFSYCFSSKGAAGASVVATWSLQNNSMPDTSSSPTNERITVMLNNPVSRGVETSLPSVVTNSLSLTFPQKTSNPSSLRNASGYMKVEMENYADEAILESDQGVLTQDYET